MPATITQLLFTFLNKATKLSLLVLFVSILHIDNLQAQEVTEYEDITVFLMIENVGGYEIDAIYMDDNIYLDVTNLFSLLKINHTPSKGNDSITGFFINEDTKYSLNLITSKASVGNNIRQLNPDEAFRTETGLYLKNTLYGELFGLYIKFNFRSLSLDLKTNHELPVIKELRLEQMRKNIDHLSGVIEVDTTLARDYHFFKGGMVDWSINSMQISEKETDTRIAVGASTELFGGEASGLLNYSTKNGFDERQQQYKWRWVNNETSIKQVQVGKIPIRSTSSLYAPFTGVSISNSPVSFRRSYGSYTLSDYTEPGWTVELYINNVIVNYTTADASGFFSFEVPLVYGSSVITLKFYGPWGEERIREETINIPYNFVPQGNVEFNLVSGIVSDTITNTFSRGEAMFGLHRNITIGTGVEYLSALSEDPVMPFVVASARFLHNFLFTGDYTYGVKSHGLLSYRSPSNLSIEIDYTKYKEGQQAISYNYLEERRVTVSLPIKAGNTFSFLRMAYRQNVLPMTTYSSAEALFSSFYKGVSTNISAYANWLPSRNPYIYSNVAIGLRLYRTLTLRPQAQFNLTNASLVSIRTEVEKTFSRIAHLSFIYEENIRSKYRSFEFTFRYDLPFAQTATSIRKTKAQVTTNESARGSLAFGSGNGYVHTDYRSSAGKAGLTIIPFLDLDNNGIKDASEPLASGLTVRLNGGRILKNNKDSLIRIVELDPYNKYLLELEDTGFENIAWQLPVKTISVMVDPSQFKQVYIPVKVMGELNGMVSVKKENRVKGQGRIILNFYDKSGKWFNRTITESDGYFNFLGLPPGEYFVMPDTVQLKRLNYRSSPPSFEFTINANEFGDILDDINFTLEPLSLEDSPSLDNKGNSSFIEQDLRIDSTRIIKPELKQQFDSEEKSDIKQSAIDQDHKLKNSEPINISRLWYVQTGAYLKKENAVTMQTKLKVLSFTSSILLEKNLYKVRIADLPSRTEASRISLFLREKGIENFINKLPVNIQP